STGLFTLSLHDALPILGPMVGMPLPNIVDPMINAFNFSLLQLILTLPIMVVSWEYFQKGFKTLFKGHPNMDSLIALGTAAIRERSEEHTSELQSRFDLV